MILKHNARSYFDNNATQKPAKKGNNFKGIDFGHCIAYHTKGQCTFKGCRWKHECLICGGDHSRLNCKRVGLPSDGTNVPADIANKV